MSVLRSRDNPRVRRWHALCHDGRARRSERSALIEGPHLLAACLDAGARPRAVLVSESGSLRPEIAALVRRSGIAPVTLADPLFRWLADTPSPSGLAAEIAIPSEAKSPARPGDWVFLEAIQDAGNVGAILRSAAAFGLRHAVLTRGCADAWSPKVLRAAMGGHFSLAVSEVEDLPAALGSFGGTLVCTVVQGGRPLDGLQLRGDIGWIFGAEGQGVSTAAAALAAERATIPLAANAESLNVAAAAAICFYERARRLSTGGVRS
jgi:TrmH family RNA methyltransferase